MGVVTIHLVRHAEHGQFGHALTGRTTVGLSEVGVRQAAKLVRHFSGADVRAVLTSPVQRAKETAGPLATALGLAPVVESGLDEIDFGEWTGTTFAALETVPGWAAWNGTRSLAMPPWGESMLAAQARATQAVLAQREAGGAVIAVSHSDVIKAVLAYMLGMPLDLLHRLEVGPASRSVITVGSDFARVEAINLPP